MYLTSTANTTIFVTLCFLQHFLQVLLAHSVFHHLAQFILGQEPIIVTVKNTVKESL